MKKPTDAVANQEWVQKKLKSNTWSGAAFAEVAFMAQDLDVPWPVDRSAGENDAMVFDALLLIEATEQPGASLEVAFQAGRATQRVLDAWTATVVATKTVPQSTRHFYAHAVQFLREGSTQSAAYTKAKALFAKMRKNAVIPTRAAFKTYLARARR